MKIVLNVELGSVPPFERELTGDMLRFGRSPDCDMTLSGDGCDLVSWEHLEIKLRPGRADVSDLNSSNGTWLNGRRLNGTATLKSGDVIQLGQTGPRLVVRELSVAAAEKTPKLEPPAKQKRERKQNEASSQPSADRVTAGIDSATDGTSRRPSATRALLVKLQNTQRGWRILGIVAIVCAAVISFVAYQQFRGRLTEIDQSVGQTQEDVSSARKAADAAQREANSAKREASSARTRANTTQANVDKIRTLDAQTIFEQFGNSVFHVRYQTDEGGWVGTAFAIDKSGLFATNAHVAGPIQDAIRRNKLRHAELVGQGGSPRFTITKALAHPKYVKGRNSPDVGLLRASIPAGKTVVVSSLASTQEVLGIKPGAQLCYIGFPQYQSGDYGSLKQTLARVYQGGIVRVMTLNKETGTPSATQLIEHDMLSWGGSSGSPIFNRDGKVVALHFSAANVEQERVDPRTGRKIVEYLPAPASSKYAVRVDLLRELLGKL